ncbi:hypothetical protein QJS10_CPB21g00167 [Acorus calamus]|uniref:Transmembrane protein n=1 Tax=Acorus calamus TaxID=4465 RepID=A0AAV9C702_ACOCL|nr:hypothetical protein QJS10_CPB21g00167 [Acorus calamus]
MIKAKMCSKALVPFVILVVSFLIFSEVAEGTQLTRKLSFGLDVLPPRWGPPSRTSLPCLRNRCNCIGCSHGLDVPAEAKVEP